VYLLHSDLKDVEQFDYDVGQWTAVSGEPGSAVQCDGQSALYRKTKFVMGQFGVMRNSRKGALRAGWRLGGREVQMANIHLFADVSNIEAASKTPSNDALVRRAALEYLLDDTGDVADHKADGAKQAGSRVAAPDRPSKRLRLGQGAQPPPQATFYFGDFNFRLAAEKLTQVRRMPFFFS
jgi:hypothetical protein